MWQSSMNFQEKMWKNGWNPSEVSTLTPGAHGTAELGAVHTPGRCCGEWRLELSQQRQGMNRPVRTGDSWCDAKGERWVLMVDESMNVNDSEWMLMNVNDSELIMVNVHDSELMMVNVDEC